MERKIETATNERREKASFVPEKKVKRICGNPNCLAEWDDANVTICLNCGWGTREVS